VIRRLTIRVAFRWRYCVGAPGASGADRCTKYEVARRRSSGRRNERTVENQLQEQMRRGPEREDLNRPGAARNDSNGRR